MADAMTFGTASGKVLDKALGLRFATVAGLAAALYFGPKIIRTFMEGSRTRDASDTADSLGRLELTNQQMVQAMQAQMPAARPRKDTYPYV